MNNEQLEQISVIAVKDKYDVQKAATLLAKIGIPVFSSTQGETEFMLNNGDNVKNNFLIRDADGWRIQSHFISDGLSITNLEIIVQSWLTTLPKVETNGSKETLLIAYKKEMIYVKLLISDFENSIKTSLIKLENIVEKLS